MIEKLYQLATLPTITFIVIITFIGLYFHHRFTATKASKAPAILTTLGILGTFFGVALGLLDFNVNDIAKSVPALIDGIKTAFWVSAWGIFWALTIKIREAIFGIPKIDINKYEGATVDDLATLLRDVKNALIGTEESTLLSQMKLARQDSNDKIDNLRKSFDTFAEKVADNNSKALIEALKEVIRDFNAKINEQFGENFKQLNEAVGRTLEWQERYRQQMIELIEQQSKSADSLNSLSENSKILVENYSSILSNSESFNLVASNLAVTLQGLSNSVQLIENQKEQLQILLKDLSTLINSAANGLPQIENKVVSIAEQLTTSVKATNDEFNNQLIKVISNSSLEIEKNTKSMISNLEQGITKYNTEFNSFLLNIVQKTNQEFNNNIQQANNEVNGNIKQLIESTKEQVVTLDKALSEELTKSLEGLGRQLASLSQRFVEDYTPLTDRLREIVQMSRKA